MLSTSGIVPYDHGSADAAFVMPKRRYLPRGWEATRAIGLSGMEDLWSTTPRSTNRNPSGRVRGNVLIEERSKIHRTATDLHTQQSPSLHTSSPASIIMEGFLIQASLLAMSLVRPAIAEVSVALCFGVVTEGPFLSGSGTLDRIGH